MLASCLVFLFLTKFGYGRDPALLCSLVFSVHPALAQAVAWIPGRNDILAAIFVLASFISFISYLNGKRENRFLFSIAFFAGAVFTKENTAVLPLVNLAYLYLMNKRLSRRDAFKLISGWAVVWCGWFVTRCLSLAGSFEVTSYDAARSIITIFPPLLHYAGKMVMPLNLRVFPMIDKTDLVYGLVALIAVGGALVISKKKRSSFILFGLTWFLLFLMPTFIRPPQFFRYFQEHRAYLPMIGFFVVLLEIDFFKNADLGSKKTLAFFALVLSAFSVLNVSHTAVFRNSLTFWESASRTSPKEAFVHFNAGLTYYAEGFADEAEREYKGCIKADPQFPNAHTFLGYLYLSNGMPREAALEFRKAFYTGPFNEYAYLNLALAYHMQGETDLAAGLWKKALALNPGNVEAARNLAAYQSGKGLTEAVYNAVELEKRGMRLPPAIKSPAIKSQP
jgi:Flp pilus assembly protein TadD